MGFKIKALLSAFALFSAATANAGIITSQLFTGDADSGVSSANTYTHAVDVNGTGATVNGVTFVPGGASGTDATHGGSWTFSIPSQNAFVNNTNNLTGSINQIARDFLYSGSATTATETLTLSGLTPGQKYRAVFYNVGFGGPGGRIQNVTDDQGGALNGYDENGPGDKNGSLIIDDYTATAASITITIASQGNNISFHQYGFSNQVVPEPASAGLLLIGATGLLARRRRAR